MQPVKKLVGKYYLFLRPDLGKTKGAAYTRVDKLHRSKRRGILVYLF